MRVVIVAIIGASLLLLTACEPKRQQGQYTADEVGKSRATEFGTVLNVREIAISGKNSEMGTLLGAGAGAGGGSYIGKGDGNSWAMAGTAIAGAVAGHFIEQAIVDRNGYEYVVQMQSGDVKTIVAEKIEGDTVFKPGDHVMLQYCDAGDHAKRCKEGGAGMYQRLLPIAKMPVYKPKKPVPTSDGDGDGK